MNTYISLYQNEWLLNIFLCNINLVLTFHLNYLQCRSIGEPMLSCSVVDEAEVDYEVVEEGSNRKRQKLVSSDGFSYCVKRETDSSRQWRCSIRRKDMSCYASVNQRGE
ncbi:hypothetical protein MAR_017978, partial [Mya arenaria]